MMGKVENEKISREKAIKEAKLLGYFDQKAFMSNEDWKKRNALTSKAAELRHEIPDEQLTNQQRLMGIYGDSKQLPEVIIAHNEYEKPRKKRTKNHNGKGNKGRH